MGALALLIFVVTNLSSADGTWGDPFFDPIDWVFDLLAPGRSVGRVDFAFAVLVFGVAIGHGHGDYRDLVA